MALPDDFSPWQHLLEMLIATHNRNVQQTFLGVPDDDISTAMGGMKIATLMTEDDTVDMVILRMALFYWVFQAALPTPIYGMPISDYQSEVTFRPQIHLFFKEDWQDYQLSQGLSPVRSDISFRLLQYTSQTINPAIAQGLALRIKELFAVGSGFTWERGTTKVTYKDDQHGYDFRLLCSGEAEATRLIETILSIQGHPFNETYLSIHTSRKTFLSDPGLQEVYGKERKKPRQRPTVAVRFYKAELHIYGLSQPVLLVGHYGRGKPLATF